MARAVAEAEDEEIFVVIEANRDAVLAFCACCTQWRRAGTAGMMVGLDYPAARATVEWLGIAPTPELLADLRSMEAASLAELHRDR